MAHYLAELIEDAKNPEVENRPAKLAACADVILGLWERRYQLPDGKRPFEELEPILRALESLDPADDTPRYFRSPRMAASGTKQNKATEKWLRIADGLDYSAKVLIRYCLTQAAQTSLDKSEKWIALAEAAGFDDGIEISFVRVIIGEKNLLKASKPNDEVREQLEDRVKRLDAFKKMADTLASDLRRQLKQAHVPKGQS